MEPERPCRWEMDGWEATKSSAAACRLCPPGPPESLRSCVLDLLLILEPPPVLGSGAEPLLGNAGRVKLEGGVCAVSTRNGVGCPLTGGRCCCCCCWYWREGVWARIFGVGGLTFTSGVPSANATRDGLAGFDESSLL